MASVAKNGKQMLLLRGKKNTGFTLVELTIALMVTAIILSAVGTLANATACADDITKEMGRQQARLRYISMRLTDLIKRANKVTIAADGFELWHRYDANDDGILDEDEGERTQVTYDSDTGEITIIDPDNSDDLEDPKTFLQCSYVDFEYIYDTTGTAVRFIIIRFDMEENGVTQTYTINARLRAWDDSL